MKLSGTTGGAMERRRMGGLLALSIISLAVLPSGVEAQQYSQQAKLVATDSATYSLGYSASLSADGNTALLGGPRRCDDGQNPSSSVGAAWIFARSDGGWAQQGAKLVGSDAVGPGVDQGLSVSLSADGNTALVGGPSDDHGTGAAWVFARNGGAWTQQGPKLVRPPIADPYKYGRFGMSVSLSGDGNTAIIGDGYLRSGERQPGGAWIFVRSGGVWRQQGEMLIGSGADMGSTGVVRQGEAVAISADGNTVILGGAWDNQGVGAAWVFKRNSDSWAQQGSKLVGRPFNMPNPMFGRSVALSGDGDTAIVGSNYSGATGAVFVRVNGTWSRQFALQGEKVGLSRDGKTAITGFGNSQVVELFSRKDDSTWSGAGTVSPGRGADGSTSFAISPDGAAFLVGVPCFNNHDGATWLYTK